jgi:hypothetical protein
VRSCGLPDSRDGGREWELEKRAKDGLGFWLCGGRAEYGELNVVGILLECPFGFGPFYNFRSLGPWTKTQYGSSLQMMKQGKRKI